MCVYYMYKHIIHSTLTYHVETFILDVIKLFVFRRPTKGLWVCSNDEFPQKY